MSTHGFFFGAPGRYSGCLRRDRHSKTQNLVEREVFHLDGIDPLDMGRELSTPPAYFMNCLRLFF